VLSSNGGGAGGLRIARAPHAPSVPASPLGTAGAITAPSSLPPFFLTSHFLPLALCRRCRRPLHRLRCAADSQHPPSTGSAFVTAPLPLPCPPYRSAILRLLLLPQGSTLAPRAAAPSRFRGPTATTSRTPPPSRPGACATSRWTGERGARARVAEGTERRPLREGANDAERTAAILKEWTRERSGRDSDSSVEMALRGLCARF
jgi:hypothetical protein